MPRSFVLPPRVDTLQVLAYLQLFASIELILIAILLHNGWSLAKLFPSEQEAQSEMQKRGPSDLACGEGVEYWERSGVNNFTLDIQLHSRFNVTVPQGQYGAHYAR